MFFRPTERRWRGKKKAEGAWKQQRNVEKSEKISARKSVWRGKRGRKATPTASGKSRTPRCFIPVRTQEESVRAAEPHWHFTQTAESKWATKTSSPSPLIRRLFLLSSSTGGYGAKRGKFWKLKLRLTFFFCTGGLVCFYGNRFWNATSDFEESWSMEFFSCVHQQLWNSVLFCAINVLEGAATSVYQLPPNALYLLQHLEDYSQEHLNGSCCISKTDGDSGAAL